MTREFRTHEIVQIAYFVRDVELAARQAYEAFGIGPFFIYKNIALRDVSYRGHRAELDHSSAYAWQGSLMIEFTQQNNPGDSAFMDMYADGGEGIHHVAMFVDDVGAEMARYQALNCDTATHYFTRQGDVEVAFVDTRALLGHMLELYPPVAALTKFYHVVEKAAREWDGGELFRYLNG